MARCARSSARRLLLCAAAVATAEDRCGIAPVWKQRDVACAPGQPPPAGISLLQVQAHGDRTAARALPKSTRAHARADVGENSTGRDGGVYSLSRTAVVAQQDEGVVVPPAVPTREAADRQGPQTPLTTARADPKARDQVVLVETGALESRADGPEPPDATMESFELQDRPGRQWIYPSDLKSLVDDNGPPCTTTWKDPRARGWWKWTAKPGTRCCFSCDARTVKGNCIRDTYFGDFGWCYTRADKSEWGSCSEDCPQYPPGEDKSKGSCVTTLDEAAKDWWPKMSTAGTPCVFGADFRDEGSHCIPEFEYGSRGWCYTRMDQTSWGSCSESCDAALPEAEEVEVFEPPAPPKKFNKPVAGHLGGLRHIIQEVMDSALGVMEEKIKETLGGDKASLVNTTQKLDLEKNLKPLRDAIVDVKTTALDTLASVEEIKACVRKAISAAAASREEGHRHAIEAEKLIAQNKWYVKRIHDDMEYLSTPKTAPLPAVPLAPNAPPPPAVSVLEAAWGG